MNMSDYEEEGHQGNGEDFEIDKYDARGGTGGSSPQPRTSSHSHGGADDHTVSKSKVRLYTQCGSIHTDMDQFNREDT